jgi:hypothetical protein
MTHWRLAAEIVVARVGASAVFAAALLVVVAAAAASHLFQQKSKLEHAQAEIARMRAQAATPANTGGPARPTGNIERLALFERTLGKRADLDAHMRAVFAAAKRNGVALKLGEYRLVNDAAGGFSRYHINFPVDGNFRSIQQFSSQVLVEFPFAALEEVSLKRESVGARELEARLRFVFFLATDQVSSGTAPATQVAETKQ